MSQLSAQHSQRNSQPLVQGQGESVKPSGVADQQARVWVGVFNAVLVGGVLVGVLGPQEGQGRCVNGTEAAERSIAYVGDHF